MRFICVITQFSYGITPSSAGVVGSRRTPELRAVCRLYKRTRKWIGLVTVVVSLILTIQINSASAGMCQGSSGGNECCYYYEPDCGCTGLDLCPQFLDVHFDPGSAIMSSRDRDLLARVAEEFKRSPAGAVIQIIGRTDSTGGRDANLALSRQRAEAVRSELINLGVPADMLKTKAYGESRPFRSNDTPMGRLRNRSVSYSVVSPD